MEMVTAYYRSLDENDTDQLRTLLSPSFRQVRPDRTFEDRSAFLEFMASGRPRMDTTHDLQRVVSDGTTVVATGVVCSEEDETLLSFADVFTVEDGRIELLETYTQ